MFSEVSVHGQLKWLFSAYSEVKHIIAGSRRRNKTADFTAARKQKEIKEKAMAPQSSSRHESII
jgi:hypothetical protein